MRFVARFLGMLACAGAFVAGVVDGTRSIADSTLRLTSLDALWLSLSPGGHAAAQAAVAGTLSQAVWNGAVAPVLAVPVFAALAVLGLGLLWLGRTPPSRIGYAVRG